MLYEDLNLVYKLIIIHEEKLVLSSELLIVFDDSLKTTSVSFFIADFSLLSCEFDSFSFKLLY